MAPIAIHSIGRHELIGNAGEAGQWAAVFFIGGFVTFMVGAAFWRFDYQAELQHAMTAWHRDSRRMRWIHSWMIVGTIFALVGTTALREMEVWFGESLWSSIGTVLWGTGAVLMLVALVWRMTIMQELAARTAETGSLPEGARAQQAWAGWTFWLHLMLAHLATVFLALSVVVSGSLPEWVGWTGIAIGALLLLGNAARIGAFSPPILVHVWFVVLGVAIIVNL